MKKHAYHDHLKQVSLFADLGEDELDVVARAATQLDYGPGRVLMHQGQSAHEMFVIVTGEVEVTRDGEHVAIIGPGGFAGEMALLTHASRNSTVATTTDTSVIHIDGRNFSNVLAEVPQIAVKMLPVVAGRVIENSDHHSH